MLMKAHPSSGSDGPERMTWRQRWGVVIALPLALLVGVGFDMVTPTAAQACTGTVLQAKGGMPMQCDAPIGPVEKGFYRFSLMSGIGALAGGVRGGAAAAAGAIVSFIF